MKIDDIKALKRPLRVSFEQQTAEQQRVVDLLWSDPADDEETRGLVTNATRDPTGQVGALKKFGADMVEKFLKANGMSMIIRSHQHLMRGEDRFAQGQLMSVSSCTDYCGVTGNNAGFLVCQKKLVIAPKIIQPSPASKAAWRDSQPPEGGDVPAILKRAPTPPRQ